VRFLLPVLLATAAFGCEARLGGGTGNIDRDDLRPDASFGGGGGSVDAGGGSQTDAGSMVAADNACGVASTQGNLGTLTGQAGAGQQGTTTQMVYSVSADTPSTASQATPDVVYVELWDNYGVFVGGPVKTGTFTITGDETDYDTCGACVLMLANVASTGTPAKLMAATSGTVTVTSIATAAGQTTSVTLTNISFTEIQAVTDQGYQPVAGSTCTSPISNATVSGVR